jgi:hypothetical protein
MTLTTNQRKCLWLAVIAAAIYFAPSIVTRATQQQRQAAPPPMKPSPFSPAPVTPPFRDMIGQFAGRATLSRGLCMFQFEIRDNREKPGTFAGYSSLTCSPIYTFRQPRPWPYTAAMMMPKPTAAILSGVAGDGAIRFSVDDAVSGPCPPKAMTVKRFGSTGLAIQFDDKCGGGKMLLSRSGR